MTLSKQDRETLIKYRLQQAEDTIPLVKLLIENKEFAAAVNRIYYGMFYCITALALKYEYKTSKHQQLLGWFNKSFVKEGLIDEKYNHILRKAFQNRTEADYGEYIQFTKDEVNEMFAEMKEFIKILKQFVNLKS
jgi:uncharacterized protein (UPF0332 family)